MRVLFDNELPIIGNFLDRLDIQSESFEGRTLSNSKLRQFRPDAIFIRSATKITNDLLDNTHLQFVGTATSGTDHVDHKTILSQHITLASAKGSNANAVAEYVVSCLLELANDKKFNLEGKTIGVIGYGNVGRRLASYCETLKMNVLVNDPPLHKENGKFFHQYSELTTIYENADIISFHTPYITEGAFTTHHLLHKGNSHLLKKDAIIVNAARGEIIDEDIFSLSNDLTSRSLIIDTWKNEPIISIPFLNKCYISTPHIAGYTANAKRNAVNAVLQQWLKSIGKKHDSIPQTDFDITHYNEPLHVSKDSVELLNSPHTLLTTLRKKRRIAEKSHLFASNFPKEEALQAKYFDSHRKSSLTDLETLKIENIS